MLKNIADLLRKERERESVLENYSMVWFSTCHTNWLFVRAKYISWAKCNTENLIFDVDIIFTENKISNKAPAKKTEILRNCEEKNQSRRERGKATTALWKMLSAMSYLYNVLWEYKRVCARAKESIFCSSVDFYFVVFGLLFVRVRFIFCSHSTFLQISLLHFPLNDL